MARDDKFVYFYAKTADELTPCTDPFWMLLFIDTDSDHATGWEGYDLLINGEIRGERTSTVMRYAKDRWTGAKGIAFRSEGNELMLRVPRSYFGDGPLAFDFHWADNIRKLYDIDEFLLHGDQAPSRRANYRFEE